MMPPCLSLRDWYEGGKSNRAGHKFRTIYLPTPVSPFHAEPLQLNDRGFDVIGVTQLTDSRSEVHEGLVILGEKRPQLPRPKAAE